MLLPLQLFSSIRSGSSNATLPRSKKLQSILSVMSPFQTVLFKIFFLVYATMTKLMDAILLNLQV